MPRRCCIPGCKGNYDSTLKSNNYASVFLFPKNEELRKKWLAAIPRKNWTPTKYSAVCSFHFAENDIQRYEKIVCTNNTIENVLLCRPKLVENAVPSIFPNVSTYSRHETKKTFYSRLKRRKNFKEHNYSKQQVIPNDECLVQECKDLDLITNFSDLVNKYKEKLIISDCWNIKLIKSKIYFYKLDYENDILVLNTQIVINDQMKLYVFYKGNKISFHELKWVLPGDMKLSRWYQLQNLLTWYKSTPDVPDSDEIILIE